jgi:hypothetical protein
MTEEEVRDAKPEPTPIFLPIPDTTFLAIQPLMAELQSMQAQLGQAYAQVQAMAQQLVERSGQIQEKLNAYSEAAGVPPKEAWTVDLQARLFRKVQ